MVFLERPAENRLACMGNHLCKLMHRCQRGGYIVNQPKRHDIIDVFQSVTNPSGQRWITFLGKAFFAGLGIHEIGTGRARTEPDLSRFNGHVPFLVFPEDRKSLGCVCQCGFNNLRRDTYPVAIYFSTGIVQKLPRFLIVNLNTCSLQTSQACPVDIADLIVG